jgi:hypothetical protein
MASVPMLGRWGFLPIAVPGALYIMVRLGRHAFPTGRGSDRALAGFVLTTALAIAAVRMLSAIHCLTGVALLASFVLLTIVVGVASRNAPGTLMLRQLVTVATAPLLVAASAAVSIAALAAVWLPVWQWDALGYHLPYVDFALVARGLNGVPDDMPYVSTYPHVVETLIIALRAMLPDDRLVDLAQIPFAIAGALATAAIARLAGAPRPTALAAGASWILAPAVFLQMPTDYVDVASAAFFLTSIYFALAASRPADGTNAATSKTKKHVLLAGLALAVYVGTKPNAPMSAAMVAALLAWIGLRAKQGPAVLVAMALLLLGCETFIANTLHYGNPVWPVEVKIGPLLLHGKTSMQHLLDSGAAAPHLHGPLLSRIARSWTAMTSPPVFDMRIGGFGPLVLVAAPCAVVTLARRKDPVMWGALVASVVAPDPSVARYVLAFPALLLAFAAPCVATVPARLRPWLGVLAGALGVFQIAYALPGLTGEGPPLSSYAGMTEAERAGAVGADGPPAPFMMARAMVASDETFAFDQSMELPYLAWESDLRYRAVWIPDSLVSTQAVESFLDRENVRVVAVADDSPTGEWLNRKPERFLKLFQCKSSPCSVFARR